MQNYIVRKEPLVRSNLRFTFASKKPNTFKNELFAELIDPKSKELQVSIVFCLTVKEANSICCLINEKCGINVGDENNYKKDETPITLGHVAACYHSKTKFREQVQQSWLKGDGPLKVIVATSAFIMGVNKPNVRNVVFTAVPLNVDDLYQGAGRAGRDGNDAKIRVYRDITDFYQGLSFLEHYRFENYLTIQQFRQVKHQFYQAHALCYNNVDCHAELLAHRYSWEGEYTYANYMCCNNCDNCIKASRSERANVKENNSSRTLQPLITWQITLGNFFNVFLSYEAEFVHNDIKSLIDIVRMDQRIKLMSQNIWRRIMLTMLMLGVLDVQLGKHGWRLTLDGCVPLSAAARNLTMCVKEESQQQITDLEQVEGKNEHSASVNPSGM